MSDEKKPIEIGARIKAIRIQRKMTLQALGEKISLGKSSISKIENGHQTPTQDLIELISKALNVRIEYLLGLDNNADREAKFVGDFIKSFSKITTAKAYSMSLGEAYEKDDLIFQCSEDYLVLTGETRLFILIKEIAKAENLKPELSKHEYGSKIHKAKNEYKYEESTKKDNYFLVSGKQMEEIIQQAVKQQRAMDKAILESQLAISLVEQPLKINKLSNKKPK